MMGQEPQLGDRARDVITGFAGVVVGRCEYLTGCQQILLIPPVDKDGKRVDGEWFDTDRCEVTEARAITVGVQASPTSISRVANGPDKAPPAR